jgi:hypothetical protein
LRSRATSASNRCGRKMVRSSRELSSRSANLTRRATSLLLHRTT